MKAESTKAEAIRVALESLLGKKEANLALAAVAAGPGQLSPKLLRSQNAIWT